MRRARPLQCRTAVILAVAAVFAAIPAPPTVAQARGSERPAWLLLEEGHRYFDRGEFGDALRSYQNALAEAAVLPEAELGMARVYAAQADDLLAIRFYRAALEQEDQFFLRELRFQARLELAEIYRRERRPEAYEQVLLEIVAEDPLFSDPAEETTRNQMREVLLSDGLDRLLILYRIEELFSLEAHQRLAIHFYDSGQDAALDHAMFAVVQTLSEAIRAYRERYFDYEFQSIVEFHRRLDRRPLIRGYLRDAELYRSLYYLGLGVEQYQPRSGVAREIMTTLVELGSDAGAWAGRAQRYLGQ